MFKKNKKAISLILTLLVIAAVLTGLLLVSQIIIRYSQAIKDIELSEKAYFAAESALEITAYDILKNYKDYSSYSLSGQLSDQITEYELEEIVLLEYDEFFSEGITLGPNQSFQLNLDINGVIYPNSLTITAQGTADNLGEVIFSQAKKDPPPLEWDDAVYSLPVDLTLDSDYYYRLRINNLNDTGEITYTIDPDTTDNEIIVGFKVKTNGIYPTSLGRYERKAEANFYQYQKFSSL